MARLAIAIVGGIVGSLIPGIGWSIGFLVGNVIGQILFPPKGPDGPRLQNLDVASSAYGQFINQGFGTVRVPGNMIWGLDIKETKHKQGKGMGGGGGNTYTYSWTGAIALGRGPITSVNRIWADTKLVYDGRGTTPSSQRAKKKTLNFRVYKGDETQLPDPAMEADVGADNAVAHRGMAYVLFNDIPLEDYGNRIPSFSFEVTFAATTSNPSHASTQIVGGSLSGSEINEYIGVDWDRDRFFTLREGSPQGIRKYDMKTMTEVQQGVAASIAGPIICDPIQGNIYTTGDGGNSQPIKLWDPDGLVELASFGASNSNLQNTMTSFVEIQDADVLHVYTIDGPQSYLITGSLFDDLGVLGPRALSPIGYIFGGPTGGGQKVLGDRIRIVAGAPAANSANAWPMGHSITGSGATTDPLTIYKLNVKANAGIGVNPDTGVNIMVSLSVNSTITPSQIQANWVEFSTLGQYLFDETDETLIIGVSGGPTNGPYQSYLCKYNKATNTFVWKTQVDAIMNFDFGHNQSRLRNGKYAYIQSGFVYEVDTLRGVIKKTAISLSDFGAQVYDSERDAILIFATVSAVTKPVLVLLNKSTTTSQGVGAIINDVASQVGLNPTTDIDVTGVTDNVRGYLLNQPMTGRAAIEPLGFAFLFDGVEIDDKVRFIKRGQNVAVSLTEEDLVRLDDETGRVIDETRQQELELPLSVSVIYLDYDKDYQQNTAKAKRISLPTPSMYSKNESTTTLPMVMVAEEAKRLADRALWSAWTERIQHKYRLSWKYLKYDPSDVVQLTLTNGVILRDRIIKGDIGADFSLEWDSVSERNVQYTSNVPADGGQGFDPQVPPGSAASRYFLLDMPYARDQDSIGETTSALHYAGSGYGDDNWPGMVVYKSSDGSSYIPAGSLTTPATWGVVTEAPGTVSNPFEFDTVNTIKVSMTHGADNLSSCTRLEALNGQNWAALLNEGTGVVELFCFTTVTANTDGSYTLSDLRRGLRGTEVYRAGHTVGEIFILLEQAAFDQIAMSFGELDVARYFLGVPVGDVNEAGAKKTIVSIGRDKMPWAPGNIAADESGGNITISYDRRSRFGGDLVDGTGAVPLFETTESYEIDIYNALGTTVLRTLTSSTESVVYSSANITTDFGSVPATLTVAVYQISAVVGRGFGEKKTVDVL